MAHSVWRFRQTASSSPRLCQDGRISLLGHDDARANSALYSPIKEAGPNASPPVVFALRFSRDGRGLAASTWSDLEANGLVNWEVAAGGLRPLPENGKAGFAHSGHLQGDDLGQNSADFSLIAAPDGKHVGVAAPRCIQNAELCHRQGELRRFGGRYVVGQSADFSPDGKLLAAGLDNGGIRFWDAATGHRPACDVPAHNATITSLAFASAGKSLVSGSLDGTAIVWDLDHAVEGAVGGQGRFSKNSWTDPGQTDGEKASRAMQAFTARPKEAVGFFKARLRPIPTVDPKRLSQLLADLQSSQFAVRQRARCWR